MEGTQMTDAIILNDADFQALAAHSTKTRRDVYYVGVGLVKCDVNAPSISSEQLKALCEKHDTAQLNNKF